MLSHGGDIYRIERSTGSKGLIDLSASINPLGMPRRAARAMQVGREELRNYPDPESTLLKDALHLRHGLDPDRVMASNGSTELIYLIPRALRPATVLITAPSFSEYERASRLAGAKIKRIKLIEREGFRIKPGAFICAMKGACMAYLCNPNSPTGTLMSREEVLEVAEAAGRLKCLLVVDEAFIEFSAGASVLGGDNAHMCVIRSMTKFHALTGLRVGYGHFPARVLKRLIECKEPWSVNTPAERAAASAATDLAYEKRSLMQMARLKAYAEAGYSRLGLEWYPSSANFHLIRVADSAGLYSAMLDRGVIVRECTSFRGLARGRFVRIAVGAEAEINRTLAALQECRQWL